MAAQRTLTYVVKMDVGDGKTKAKDFRVTLKTMEQDADKASAQVDKLAQSIGSKYATQVKTAIDQTKTVSNEIKAATREANKAERTYNQLSAEYKHLTARTGKTAEQQEKMNALHRLGANATLTQKKEIIKLVQAQQAQVKATGATQRSMRGLRGQAQNLGWQLQDISVQAQMGTDALVILGQQGSQLASGFGAMGALVGAGIAVVSALAGVALATDKTTKKMRKSSEIVKTLADDYSNLTSENQKFARSLLTMEIGKQEKALKKLRKEQKDVIGFWDLMFDSAEEHKSEMAEYNANIVEQELSLKKLKDQLNELSTSEKASTQRMIDGQKPINDMIVSAYELANTYGFTAKQMAVYEAEIAGANDLQVKAIELAYDQIEAKEKKAKAEEKAAKAESEAKKKAIDDQKQLEKDLATMAKYDPNVKLSLLQKQYSQERKLLEGNVEALARIDQHYADERIKINGSFWEKYAVAAQENLGSFDEQVANSLDRFSAGFGNAVANAVFESDSLGEAMANIFKDVGKNMVAFFAEWAAQKLMLWALDQIVNRSAQTAAATTMTSNALAMSQMSAINAYSSTAAIPVVGPALAPAAAATAIATTAPMASTIAGLAFAGVFDKGGNIPSGSAGIVSEYGDELVGGTMVYNGSPNSLKVTGREETARMNSTSNRNTFNINSYGNASPEAIARATARALKKGSKALDNAVYDSMNRGRTNKGKRFNA